MRRFAPLVLLLLGLAATAPARAAGGPCLSSGSGPRCHYWFVKVTRVVDGDTIEVRQDGRIQTVRFNDVQAMETRGPLPDECHGAEATRRVKQLVRRSHGRVRLAAENPASRSDVRLRRAIGVRLHGRWVDLGGLLIREGHGLWMPSIIETAWNHDYDVAEQLARRDGKRLWNPTYCGPGPDQDVPVRVWVRWNANGFDIHNLNDEWVRLTNMSPDRTLRLGGWVLRDAEHRYFHFPARTALAPGGEVTVHIGSGTPTATDLYWNEQNTMFDNAGTSQQLGGGAYLFDHQGDLRASMLYPCLVACSDPNQGALSVTAHPRRPESVSVRNVSAHPVDLYGYELMTSPDSYSFGPSSVLEPGETMQVDVEGSPASDTRLHRHWGFSEFRLPDAGGAVALQTYDAFTLDCVAWGSGRC